MAVSKSANTTGNRKKRRTPVTAWKKGQSGNPKGRPRSGESWAELIKQIGELTPKAAAESYKAIAGRLAEIGDNVTLKEAVVLRVYAALLFEPDARLLNALMDRAEGKVSQPIDLTWQKQLEQNGITPEQASSIFDAMVSAAAAQMALPVDKPPPVD